MDTPHLHMPKYTSVFLRRLQGGHADFANVQGLADET